MGKKTQQMIKDGEGEDWGEDSKLEGGRGSAAHRQARVSNVISTLASIQLEAARVNRKVR